MKNINKLDNSLLNKKYGDELTAEEFDKVTGKINEIIDWTGDSLSASQAETSSKINNLKALVDKNTKSTSDNASAISKLQSDTAKNIADTKSALEKKIADGDTALSTQITNINSSLESKIASLKSSLEKNISDVQTAEDEKIEELRTDTATKINDLKKLINSGVTDSHILKLNDSGRLEYVGDSADARIQSDDVIYTGSSQTVTEAMSVFTEFDKKGEIDDLSIS